MNKMLESVDTVHTHTHTHTHTQYNSREIIKKAKTIAFIKEIYITDQLLI